MKMAYSGHFGDATGFGEAARRMVQALEAVGADVRPGVVLTDGGMQLEPLPPEMARFLARRPHQRPDVHLMHVIANVLPSLPQLAPSRVAVTCWETDQLPDAILNGCRVVDQVVVPCQQNLDVFTEAGIPTVCVPYPILPVSESLEPIPRIAESTRRIFYAIGTWQRRKNFEGILTAFLTATAGRRDVGLVLKIGGSSLAVASARQEIRAQIAALNLGPDVPPVDLVTRVTPGQLAWLHHRGTCFVSLSRGEGFNFPLADAYAAGRIIVATDWGGPRDILRTPTGHARPGVALIRSTMTPVVQPYPLFSGHQRWAEPDLCEAQAAIQAIAEDPQSSSRRYVRDLSACTLESVGTRLLEALAWQPTSAS